MIKKIIELVLIVALIVSIYFLGYTKQLHLLINPRYFFFIYGSLTILFIFVIIQILLPLDKQKHKTVDISYILIIIIVILMFSTSYADYQESISGIKGVNLGNKTVYDSNIEATPVQPKKTENISVFNELKIDDSNYYDVIDSLYNNSEIHKGQTITLTGFITNYSDLGSDNFVLSRLIMICCAADSSVCGLVCNSSQVDHIFQENLWYEIKGVIEYKNISVNSYADEYPVINITNYRNIEPLEDPYIYPVFN